MTKPGSLLRNSLVKRLEAIARYKARKAEFLETKKEILSEIAQARITYNQTMAQLPDQDFNQ